MRRWFVLLGLLIMTPSALAQDRDTKVRNDRKAFDASLDWIYNDLVEGVRVAKESGKPMLVIFRCIPCEACQEFDDDVARRDPIIRDMLDKFVCVRIVQANTIDLTRFQHDFDQSFAAYMMNADMTIYGRFGTRSERPEAEDISLEGFRKAMEEALSWHESYPKNKAIFAGKQVKAADYKTPRDYPSLAGKYGETIDYEGKTTQSCIHCHQIRDAERVVYRTAKQPMPDDVLYPYPDPSTIGLKLDPKEAATVQTVTPNSPAEKAGLKVGDKIKLLGFQPGSPTEKTGLKSSDADKVRAYQPLLSIADVQWVLHNAPSTARLWAMVMRGGDMIKVELDLPEGWKRQNISWRATTWDLRRMGLGGLFLEELTDEQRKEAGLSNDTMALRVRHAGEYGDHAVAKKAGVRIGDILVSYDGRSSRMSESSILAYALQSRKPGDEVELVVLRNGEKKTMKIVLQ